MKEFSRLIEFPSPYGVLFILIKESFKCLQCKRTLGFPSPYGVLFILIFQKCKELIKEWIQYRFPSPYGVLFILIVSKNRYMIIYLSFRLLTEYYSFLFKNLKFKFNIDS